MIGLRLRASLRAALSDRIARIDYTYKRSEVITMSVRRKWKIFGRSTGRAFKNFGKAVAMTAKVTVGNESRVDEEGNSKLKKAWSEAGRGIGKAGSSLGHAAAATAKKVVGKETPDEPEVVDVEVVSETPAEPETQEALSAEEPKPEEQKPEEKAQ